MKVMILAAGRGERMRPLTDHTPKPLLSVGGQPLVVHLIRQLVREGFADFVINIAYLPEAIEKALGDGGKFGAHIRYSRESETMETGGGILYALPLLGSEPFLAVNADLWTDYPFSTLGGVLERTISHHPVGNRSAKLAHLVLVPNPKHHADGDFGLHPSGVGWGRVSNTEGRRLTFSGIGVYRPELFQGCKPGSFPLRDVLQTAVEANMVTGECYTGKWLDIGTPERLRSLME